MSLYDQDEITHEALQEWAVHYAQAATTTIQSGEPYLVFRVGREHFALAMDELDEVANIINGIALPAARLPLLGLTNLRGEVLLLLDTGAALGCGGSFQLGPRNRTLIIRDDQGRRTGLMVDGVDGIELLDPNVFRPHPQSGVGPIRRLAVTDHQGHSLSLLDVSSLRSASFQQF